MKIGIATLCARRGHKKANLQAIIEYAEMAAEYGCHLVVFPEYSINGPWVHYDPGAQLHDLINDCEPIPGNTTDFLTKQAKRLNIALCVGLAEQGLASKPFNTQLVIGPGGIMHKQRKLQPTSSEVDFYRGGGDDVATFVLHNQHLGIIICADRGYDRIHDLLYSQGSRLFLAPHYDCIKKFENPGNSWNELLSWHDHNRLVRHREIARRLQVTVVYCDAKDPRESFSDDYPHWVHYVSGKSAVISPDDQIIAQNEGNEESLIMAEI